eukprot:5116433-Pleurochrysis_carterae.AAC.3
MRAPEPVSVCAYLLESVFACVRTCLYARVCVCGSGAASGRGGAPGAAGRAALLAEDDAALSLVGGLALLLVHATAQEEWRRALATRRGTLTPAVRDTPSAQDQVGSATQSHYRQTA